MSLTEIKTVPFDINNLVPVANQPADAQPEAPISLDEAAAMYDPQEFSKNLVLEDARHLGAPRSKDLQANVTQETVQITADSLLEDIAPVEVTKQGIIGRIKNRMTQARQTITDIFHKEQPTPTEKITRRKALGSVVGSVAVGLVIIAGLPAASPNQAVEQVASPTTATTIAKAVRTPAPATTIAKEIHVSTSQNSIANTTAQALNDRAKVTQLVAEHPKEAKDFFTWVSTAKAQNPGITNEQMNQQFIDYTKPSSQQTKV